MLSNQYFVIIDALIFLLTPFLSLLIRLDGWELAETYFTHLALITAFFICIKLFVLNCLGFYKRYWRFASLDDLEHLALCTTAFTLCDAIFLYSLHKITQLPLHILPHSVPLVDGLLSFILLGFVRFSVPLWFRHKKRKYNATRHERVFIFGAGTAGISLVREMQNHSNLDFEPVAFIDDDPGKLNLSTCGLKVIGNRYQMPELAASHKVGQVIIAIPSAPGNVLREIVDICQSQGLKTSTLPSINEILNGRFCFNKVRDIKIEDLLRREPIQTDFSKISQFLQGKTILVTGAGGSIGSELCRQIYNCYPSRIILVGHGENSVFSIQQELDQIYSIQQHNLGHASHQLPKPQLIPCIADLRSIVRLEHIFSYYQPYAVFHAAAHKHVPLMELNPSEAVTNNIQGTKNLLELSQKHNVERFVMISTDKAVNPTSIMGATKRVAELLVLQAAQHSKKPFVVVRFGNVLGSRGSVIPTFQRQIEAGGPVTVTHPQMCRYFMTIPEAVQLVLQAAVSSHEGQIFMLNMGQPVKIVDLAKDLIRLSGYEVGKDIEIVFSGMRPGEKLFEELLVPGENYESTSHDKLLVVKNATQHLPEQLMDGVNLLCSAAAYNNDSLACLLLEQLVTGYTPKRQSDSDSNTGSRNNEHASGAVYHDLIQIVKSLRNAVKPDYCLNGDDLEQAILREELHIFYQPIMLLESEHIVTGFEALLRWNHPLQGLMPSAAFLPFAEETGIINTIGWWGLQEVCLQLKDWQHQFRTEQPITVSVNLSHHQLLQRDLIPRIDEILRKTGVNTDRLRLEIPEGFIDQAPDVAIPILLKLKGLGLHLQIDNFGYSAHQQLSAAYDWLHIFDSLKVDRSQVQSLGTDRGSIEFFRSALEISQKFGIELIATGIETPSQVMRLKTLNFKYGQGYFFLEPVSGGAVQALMSNGLTVT